MRLLSGHEELTLQVKLGTTWENLYQISPYRWLDADFEVANWFTATHNSSPFLSNLIAARAGPEGTRYTFFNGRLSIRRPPDRLERRMLNDWAEYKAVLTGTFGLAVSDANLAMAIEVLDRKGTRGAMHLFFN
jgi:N-hydroxyarylamine O-acetyltransferase